MDVHTNNIVFRSKEGCHVESSEGGQAADIFKIDGGSWATELQNSRKSFLEWREQTRNFGQLYDF
jgi:hypothetical protein